MISSCPPKNEISEVGDVGGSDGGGRGGKLRVSPLHKSTSDKTPILVQIDTVYIL